MNEETQDKSNENPAAWQHRLFRLMVVCFVLLNAGYLLDIVALNISLFGLTKSLALQGVLALLCFCPFCLLPLSEAISDVIDRRRLLVVCNITSLLCSVGMGIFLALNLASPAICLLFAFFLSLSQALLYPLFLSAFAEMLPLPARQDGAAISNVSQIISVGLAALLTVFFFIGPSAGFFLHGAFCLFTGACLKLWLRKAKLRLDPKELFVSSLRRSYNSAAKSELEPLFKRTAMLVPALGSLPFFLPEFSLFPFFMALYWCGQLLGAASTKKVITRFGVAKLYIGTGVTCAVFLVLCALIQAPLLAALSSFAAGFGLGLCLNTSLLALQHESKIEPYRGRLFFFMAKVFLASGLVGIIVGEFAALTSTVSAELFLAACIAVGGIYSLKLPEPPSSVCDEEASFSLFSPAIPQWAAFRPKVRRIRQNYQLLKGKKSDFLRLMRAKRAVLFEMGAYSWELQSIDGSPQSYSEDYVVDENDNAMQHPILSAKLRAVEKDTKPLLEESSLFERNTFKTAL